MRIGSLILTAAALFGLAACEARHPGPYTNNSLGADVARFGHETGAAVGGIDTGAMRTTNQVVNGR